MIVLNCVASVSQQRRDIFRALKSVIWYNFGRLSWAASITESSSPSLDPFPLHSSVCSACNICTGTGWWMGSTKCRAKCFIVLCVCYMSSPNVSQRLSWEIMVILATHTGSLGEKIILNPKNSYFLDFFCKGNILYKCPPHIHTLHYLVFLHWCRVFVPLAVVWAHWPCWVVEVHL